MGASQSSGGGGGGGRVAEPGVKTSYYELLGVERQATEEEIKKAYRRKALELHPDRNYGNEEYATKVFAEVQAAHQVLSDPQERAWYDSHESAILRGDDVGEDEGVPTYDNVRITTADDLARLVGRFNSGIEFSDAPSGFFGFLRDTFDQLAKEESIAASWEDSDAREYPTFGHKSDAYDDVVKGFYASWSSFSTIKNFAWKDKYRLSEAPDRWYRRRMEQENKKFRQDGIREFNDAVRSLVAFVRKRDPRYVPSTQTEDERQKVLRDAAAAQAARARAANEAKLNVEVPEWTKSREPDPLAEMEGTFEEEEVVEHVFECVACNKIFKSENQWSAHEQSKKHQKAVYTLQKKMRKDNAHLDLSPSSSGITTPDVRKQEEDLEAREDVEANLESASTLRNGHEANDTKTVDEDGHGDEGYIEVDAEADDDVPVAVSLNGSDSEDDDDYASTSTIQARLGSARLGDATDKLPSTSNGSTDRSGDSKPEDLAQDPESDTQAGKKMGKAALKRAKKAAAAATDSQVDANQKCHLKDHPEHAALRPGGGKKKGKGKR
ncbi:hypothetical protein LTR53_001703 [Teratosphaeriaceae sp. CCFEE 6253]|nr:hypothetical protein LTR53_001703 [Teratosphaeriaceae sp. CCFEE 6253]